MRLSPISRGIELLQNSIICQDITISVMSQDRMAVSKKVVFFQNESIKDAHAEILEDIMSFADLIRQKLAVVSYIMENAQHTQYQRKREDD